MGSRHRFSAVADYIARQYPVTTRILDVACGTGTLQKRLRSLGFTDILSLDPACKNKSINKRRTKFHWDMDYDCDLIVGIHPDGASEHIARFAEKRKVSSIIMPCCVIPTLSSFKGNYWSWYNHLKGMVGHESVDFDLKFKGRSVGFQSTPC